MANQTPNGNTFHLLEEIDEALIYIATIIKLHLIKTIDTNEARLERFTHKVVIRLIFLYAIVSIIARDLEPFLMALVVTVWLFTHNTCGREYHTSLRKRRATAFKERRSLARFMMTMTTLIIVGVVHDALSREKPIAFPLMSFAIMLLATYIEFAACTSTSKQSTHREHHKSKEVDECG